MSSTEKIKGATQTCSGCQTPLTCREITKEWNGKTEKKLQWQNTINEKPHFKKNMGTGKYDCINIPEGKPIYETREAPEKKRLTNDDYLKKKQTEIQQQSKLNTQQTESINKEIDLLQGIENLVISKLPTDTNPQKIGLYIKLVRNSLEELSS